MKKEARTLKKLHMFAQLFDANGSSNFQSSIVSMSVGGYLYILLFLLITKESGRNILNFDPQDG